MALDLVAAIRGRTWPSGDELGVRVGIATGPVVAGVIGRRKFAYDVWGDTVNLASRLQAAGRPGCVLVADAVAERAGDRFVYGPPEQPGAQGQGPPGRPVRGGPVEPDGARHGVTRPGPRDGRDGYVPVYGVQTRAILPPVATNPP